MNVVYFFVCNMVRETAADVQTSKYIMGIMKKVQGYKKFLFLHKPFNGPIINDGSHFANQPLLPCKSYHLKLNLANWPDKRDCANLKTPAVRNCSRQQLHINAVIITASVDVHFPFVWLHLARRNRAVGVLPAIRTEKMILYTELMFISLHPLAP